MDDAADNIKAAQKKQIRDYDRRHMSKTEIKVDDIVLLKINDLMGRVASPLDFPKVETFVYLQ